MEIFETRKFSTLSDKTKHNLDKMILNKSILLHESLKTYQIYFKYIYYNVCACEATQKDKKSVLSFQF